MVYLSLALARKGVVRPSSVVNCLNSSAATQSLRVPVTLCATIALSALIHRIRATIAGPYSDHHTLGSPCANDSSFACITNVERIL